MEIEELAKRVAVALMNKEFTMCTAEECTCGLVGATVASQDYAQRWYKGSITTYTEEEAVKILEVMPSAILRCDFVSCQVAQQMALKALNMFKSNIATAIVGYVDGYGSSDIKAGDIQICVAKTANKNDGISFKYKKINVEGQDRGKNIEVAIEEALRATLDCIMGEGD
jgi:nicotinamide-nucleotide amidase